MKNYLKKSIAIISSIILASSGSIFAGDPDDKEQPSSIKEIQQQQWDLHIQRVKELKDKNNYPEKDAYNDLRTKSPCVKIKEFYKKISDEQKKEILSKKQVFMLEMVRENVGNYMRFWNSSTEYINDLFEHLQPLNESITLYSGLEDFEAQHIISLYNQGKNYDDHDKMFQWPEFTTKHDALLKDSSKLNVFSHFVALEKEKHGILYSKGNVPACRKDFISTTTNLEVAAFFGGSFHYTNDKTPRTILKINVPKGIKLFAINSLVYTKQKEFLLKGNSKFKITNVSEDTVDLVYKWRYVIPFFCTNKFRIIEADLLP